MLLPPDDRALLTDLLRPPARCTLDRAIATTFTLDLESLLSAPLAFAAHAVRDEADDESVMAAVLRCADRMDVFCQAGAIQAPADGSRLLALLEKMVHPVARPRAGHLFHPKIWLVRYAGDEDRHMRLLVLSRNLARSRSWDIGLRLDGWIGNQVHEGNRPLEKLLRRAIDLAVTPLARDRREAVDALINDLVRTDWDPPEGFSEMRLHALGIAKAKSPFFAGTRRLVMSPFVQEQGLKFCPPDGRTTLVGRQEDLDGLPEGALDGYATFVLNDLAVLDRDDEPDLMRRSGLHAKAYVIEHGNRAHVFVGSANASAGAFGGNLELLVELVGSRRDFGLETLMSSFGPLLEEYEPGDSVELEDDIGRELESYLFDLGTAPFRADVVTGKEPHTMRVAVPSLPEPPGGAGLGVSLHTRRGAVAPVKPGKPAEVVFDDLRTTSITRFLIVTVTAWDGTTRRAVVVAELSGDPADRLDQVLAEQIDTPEKFLRFVALLLGLGFGDSAESSGGDAETRGHRSRRAGELGLLELLLGALAERPAQLEDLARLINRMAATEQGRAVLPDGFLELWDLVEEARRGLIGATA
ncbi:phospholipase D family protein [Actinoplanes sp. TRM 88003]|uniref:Phospholipase D family protein n=1 Tax=Paractinoplanes aksuensis TaxID=2939490 RepID=A0ABT1E2M4_9ACTN|nr:phospholipase D family protein [Actinoplanes aksuensis]MCO8277260.1 phospholipase D family protein [Actinoplanes aksuensis]